MVGLGPASGGETPVASGGVVFAPRHGGADAAGGVVAASAYGGMFASGDIFSAPADGEQADE